MILMLLVVAGGYGLVLVGTFGLVIVGAEWISALVDGKDH